MPWDPGQKKVIRQNPSFTGPTVWQQDQQAPYKIVAARHDNHDQDLADSISATVNLDGYTVMRANFDMGTFRIVGLADGIDPADAVNKSQLDVVDAKADANASAIAAIETTNPDNIITANTWDNTQFKSVNIADNIPAIDLKRFDDFKAGQQIRHLGIILTGGLTDEADTALGNRWYLPNDGNDIDLTITKPSAIDADLGEVYQVEGMIMIDNGAAPGLVTINGVSASDILGAPSINPNVNYVLSYMIMHYASAPDFYHEIYVWSTA